MGKPWGFIIVFGMILEETLNELYFVVFAFWLDAILWRAGHCK